jgi:hypothetical protein
MLRVSDTCRHFMGTASVLRHAAMRLDPGAGAWGQIADKAGHACLSRPLIPPTYPPDRRPASRSHHRLA